MQRKLLDIDELDKKIIDKDRELDSEQIKRQGIEKQFELTKKQLGEKVSNLNEIIDAEKDTRNMWIERYEKEQSEHTKTQGELIKAKSDLKD